MATKNPTVVINLTRGLTATIDAADEPRVSRHSWYAYLGQNGVWYAAARIKGKNTYLHRFLTNAPAGADVDHFDGDGLNNTSANLRVVSRATNSRNRGANKGGSSGGYKGVTWSRGKWTASIGVNGILIYLGRFESVKDAARAYDHASFIVAGPQTFFNFGTPAVVTLDEEIIAKLEAALQLPPLQPVSYRGVYPARNGRYLAQINVNRRTIALGAFATAEDAAKAYDAAARLYRGDAAYQNFPQPATDEAAAVEQ